MACGGSLQLSQRFPLRILPTHNLRQSCFYSALSHIQHARVSLCTRAHRKGCDERCLRQWLQPTRRKTLDTQEVLNGCEWRFSCNEPWRSLFLISITFFIEFYNTEVTSEQITTTIASVLPERAQFCELFIFCSYRMLSIPLMCAYPDTFRQQGWRHIYMDGHLLEAFYTKLYSHLPAMRPVCTSCACQCQISIQIDNFV